MTISINAPQFIWFLIVLFSMITSVTQHGKPKTGDHNAFIDFIAYTVGFFASAVGWFFLQVITFSKGTK